MPRHAACSSAGPGTARPPRHRHSHRAPNRGSTGRRHRRSARRCSPTGPLSRPSCSTARTSSARRRTDLTGRRYAAALNAASIGRDTSTTRTEDQTVQARFWAGPIWNYWNEIAQSLLRTTGLMTATRVFAQLNPAMADAVIAFYDAKYHHRIWRPVTAIRLAGTDGNPATTADPTWTSLVSTSPDPGYPGGHSVVGQTAATLLAAAVGQRHQFVVTSEVLPGVTRTFSRLRDAGDESGAARLYGGVHTGLDHEAGQRLGTHVTRAVLARF